MSQADLKPKWLDNSPALPPRPPQLCPFLLSCSSALPRCREEAAKKHKRADSTPLIKCACSYWPLFQTLIASPNFWPFPLQSAAIC